MCLYRVAEFVKTVKKSFRREAAAPIVIEAPFNVNFDDVAGMYGIEPIRSEGLGSDRLRKYRPKKEDHTCGKPARGQLSSSAPRVFFFPVGLLDTVPGTAKPLNSQLQLSHKRKYRKKSFESTVVCR